MKDRDPTRGPDVPPDAEPPDTGEPIHELAGFRHTASRSFVDGLRRRLHRRMTGSHVVTFAWHAPVAILFEFLNLVFGLFEPPDSSKGDSR